MPFFGHKKRKKDLSKLPPPDQRQDPQESVPYTANRTEVEDRDNQLQEPASQTVKPKLVFHCQQAHGSPTGVISGFSNVKELYEKIAACYDMDPAQVSEVHSEYYIFCKLLRFFLLLFTKLFW